MKKLNNEQLNFLLDNFFENDKYPCWRNIGRKLLENGKCIIAGNKSIWIGGIGNFIETSSNEDYVDCVELKLNLDEFLHSKWFEEIYHYNLESFKLEKRRIDKKCEDIENIMNL